jgi:hypothetical protein
MSDNARSAYATCRLCGQRIVLKSVPPGSVWTTLAEEAVCECGTVGHEPAQVCDTDYCEDFGEPVESHVCPRVRAAAIDSEARGG